MRMKLASTGHKRTASLAVVYVITSAHLFVTTVTAYNITVSDGQTDRQVANTPPASASTDDHFRSIQNILDRFLQTFTHRLMVLL